MTRLILLRHGLTDWNRQGRLQGQADPPLNEAGREQARRAAAALEHFEPGVIYASDLQRAAETAAILAERLELPVRIEPQLREIDQGEWEGMLAEEVRRRYRREVAALESRPLSFRIPGGETLTEVADRVRAAADRIAADHPDQCVVVVSHGLALATLLCSVRGIPLAQARRHIPENAVPAEILWPDGRAAP